MLDEFVTGEKLEDLNVLLEVFSLQVYSVKQAIHEEYKCAHRDYSIHRVIPGAHSFG